MRANEEGFTLIETLVAMTVLTIGIFALYAMQVAAMRGNHVANVISQASNHNALKLEQLLAYKFDDERYLKDRHGNSKLQDENMAMGKGDFGLDKAADLKPDADLATCRRTASHCDDSKDDLYRIAWNVAENYPVIGVKTIRMHVRSKANPQLRPVTYEIIRNDPNTGF